MISAHFEKGRCYFGAFNPKTDQGGVSFFRFKIIGFLLSKLGFAYKVKYQDGAVYIKSDSFNHWLQRHHIQADKGLTSKQVERLIQQVCNGKPPASFVTLGNAKLEEAEVFCLTEKHGSEKDAKRNGEILNKYYRPGDLIFIEGVEIGKSGKAGQYYMTRFVNPDYPVQGWESPNFREHMPFSAEWHEMSDKLTYFMNLSNPKEAIEKYPIIAKYVGIDEKKINTNIRIIESNANKKEEVIKYLVFTLSENLEELMTKKYLSLMKGKGVPKERIIKGNDSICERLSENKDQNVRKFFITGTAHPLNLPGFPTVNKLQSELQKHPFVVCVDRQHFEKANLGKRNPNLALVR